MVCGVFKMSAVPEAEVQGVVERFETNVPPPLSVARTPDGAGTFTVTATFPPCPGNTSHSTAVGAAVAPASAPTLAPAAALGATGGVNVVVDISHHNGTVNLASAADDGIAGVIQKATQGRSFVDPNFRPNRKKALANGLLFGAYHFGTGGNGVAQAQRFLETVEPDSTTLVALDFEDNPTGDSMSLEEAREFITHVQSQLGRSPVFYSGHTIKRVLQGATDPVLRQCPLWLAQYGPTPVVPPCWPTWTMWQYTDGAVGPDPHSVKGIGRCDRDRFNGDEAALKAWWAT